MCAMVIAACGTANALAGAALTSPAPPDEVVQPAKVTVNQRVAKELVRLALLDLQATGQPEIRDYRIAAMMMEAAHELAPKDVDILRMMIDAWSEAGDRARVIAHTNTLVNLDGGDIVAQLRLISSGISSLQDVDQRLAAYDTLLGPKYEKKLDQSVRSRLALDAALLLREKGDSEGFGKRLGEATAWDSTNKDAASLAATFFSLRVDDPAGRFTLLINLLKADPFDPETHLAMARELAAGGAYKQSKRFYESFQNLMARRSQHVGTTELAEYQIVGWNVGGAEVLVKEARLSVEQQRAEVEAKRRALIAIDAPQDQIPDPENLRLPMETERVRVSAAAALGDEGQLDYAVAELETTFSRQIKVLQDPKKWPAGMTEDGARVKLLTTAAELVWLRLWTGRNWDQVGKALDDLSKNPRTDKDIVQRMKGWLKIREKEFDAAEQLLLPLAEDDPLAAMGLALSAEMRGNKDEALRRYTAVYEANMGTLVGASARTRLTILTGKAPLPAPLTTQLDELARGIPNWLEGMIVDPHRMVSVTANPVSNRIGSLDPIYLKIRIVNLAPIPLGIGPDRPLNSTMLLVPRLSVGLRAVAAGNAATVVRLDRKLRLLPQESMEITVWADAGITGYIMDQFGTLAAELRWRLVQGFVVDEDGTYLPGPMNAYADSGSVLREASSKSELTVESLVKFIDNGSIDDLAECLLVVKGIAAQAEGQEGTVSKEDRELIAQSLAKRYSRLDGSGKLQMLAKLPGKALSGWLGPLDEAISKETDPAVLRLILLTRVVDAADPIFAVATSTPDARLTEVAGLMRARLESGGETLSRVGMKPPSGAKPETPPPAPEPAPGVVPVPGPTLPTSK